MKHGVDLGDSYIGDEGRNEGPEEDRYFRGSLEDSDNLDTWRHSKTDPPTK